VRGDDFVPYTVRPRRSEDLLADGGGRGLFIVSNVSGWMTVAAKRAGGSKVTVELPVTRAPERDIDPPRRRAGSLPAPQEVRPDGSFGKESFLRALVVQLAEAVERNEGPCWRSGSRSAIPSAASSSG
jgi:hypothetical protein